MNPATTRSPDDRLESIETAVQEIRSAMLGSMGMPGLIQIVQSHEEWKQKSEKERSYQRGIIATVGAIAGVAGSFIGKALFSSGQ